MKINKIRNSVEWGSRIGALYIIYAIAIFFVQSKNVPGLNKWIVGFVAALIGYVFVIWPIGILLKSKIYGLSNPERNDPEAESIAGWIATAILIGVTAILLLFGVDYLGHTAAVDRAIEEKKREKNEPVRNEPVLYLYRDTWPASHWEFYPFIKIMESRLHEEYRLPASKNENKLPELPPATWLERTGNSLGTFGDFFGGILNPLLTFGTLIALVITVLMQRVQLKEARSEAKRGSAHEQKSSFETTFFNMLNLHAENARNLFFSPSVIPSSIRDRLPIWRQIVQLGVGTPQPPPPVHGRAVFAEVLSSTARGANVSQPQHEIYRILQVEHNDVLGHYFRNLYQILDHIDRFHINGVRASYRLRKRYSNILRAQLSSHELSVLFLNCFGSMVDNGSFREKIVRYRFFEHLPISIDDTGELRAPGIDRGSKEIFFGYFTVATRPKKRWKSGAFGQNNQIRKYLDTQALS